MRACCIVVVLLLLYSSILFGAPEKAEYDEMIRTDVLVIGATPCGISAAIASARCGSKVILTDTNDFIGGMMTNGLGRTDIGPKNTVGGIFEEFVGSVYDYYVTSYGIDSQQVADCNGGYYFEPSVAERILNRMVKDEKNITLRLNLRPESVLKFRNRVHGVNYYDVKHNKHIQIRASVFIDATYEGDVAAFSGVGYRVGRESREEQGEAYAGVIYLDHEKRMVLPGTTGEGDERVQAYNYRICLTKDPGNRVLPGRPDNYDRNEYLQVIDSIEAGRIKRIDDVLNIEPIPNGKSDTNNMPKSMISTDLPEENYDYPDADWKRRGEIAKRHKDYILGLVYFLQNDPEMPESLRLECREWGFAKDEYVKNGNFPRQMYIREARRIYGLYTFTSHDAMLAPGMLRTPVFFDGIACGGYAIDSHAVRKKEPGQDRAMEGFFWLGGMTRPYQIPYRVMVPQDVDALLVPGAVSATHLGFGTLRMEPVWMAMGQAAGTAAYFSSTLFIEPREVPVNRVQSMLLEAGQVLTVFDDLRGPDGFVSEDAWKGMEFFGTRGFFGSYEARPGRILTRGEAAEYLMSAIKIGDFMPAYGPFVKHGGGGDGLSSLQQLEKLGIALAGDPDAVFTEGELGNWMSNIEPWIDGSLWDTWAKNVKPRESLEMEFYPVSGESGMPVSMARFCEALYKKFRSETPAEVH